MDDNKALLLKSKELIANLAKALDENIKIVEHQKVVIKEMQPYVQFASAVIDSDKYYSWAESAKLLHDKLYEGKQATGQRGRNKMINFLRECDVIKPKPSTEPYQKYVNQGLFFVKEEINQHIGVVMITRVTGKGLQWLLEKLIEWEYVEWLGVKDKKCK